MRFPVFVLHLLLCKFFPKKRKKRTTGKVTGAASALHSNLFIFIDFASVFKAYYTDILTAKAIQKLSQNSCAFFPASLPNQTLMWHFDTNTRTASLSSSHSSACPAGLTKTKTCFTSAQLSASCHQTDFSTHGERLWSAPVGVSSSKELSPHQASKQGIRLQRCNWVFPFLLWTGKNVVATRDSKGLNRLGKAGAYQTPHLLRRQCTSPGVTGTREFGPESFWGGNTHIFAAFQIQNLKSLFPQQAELGWMRLPRPDHCNPAERLLDILTSNANQFSVQFAVESWGRAGFCHSVGLMPPLEDHTPTVCLMASHLEEERSRYWVILIPGENSERREVSSELPGLGKLRLWPNCPGNRVEIRPGALQGQSCLLSTLTITPLCQWHSLTIECVHKYPPVKACKYHHYLKLVQNLPHTAEQSTGDFFFRRKKWVYFSPWN